MPVVVVTGASQGIGEAVAHRFSREKQVRVALLARSRDRLETVADRCRAEGAEAWVLPCDVTDETQVGRVAQDILDSWGAPDVLVNNAGQFRPGTLVEVSVEEFRSQVEVNLTSAFLVTRAFLPSMIERRRGTLLFVASVASIRAYPGDGAYCAAKHGLLGLARAVREETRELGIRVTALIPGATLTPSWDGVDLPESRFMPPEDVASAAFDVYRLSDRTVVEELVLRPQLGDI